MDDLDVDTEQKNLVGGIDRAVINIGLICLLIFPTYFFLIFRPKAFVPLLRGEAEDGRDGLKLGPGVTFVLTILLLIAAGYLFRADPATDPTADLDPGVSSGIRQALAEGNLWRSIILSLPLYFAGLVIGLIVKTTHMLFRRTADLRQAIGIGLYILSTLLILIIPLGIASDRFEIESSEFEFVAGAFVIFVIGIVPWQIYSFSRHNFGNGRWLAALISIASFVLFFISMAVLGFFVSTFDS